MAEYDGSVIIGVKVEGQKELDKIAKKLKGLDDDADRVSDGLGDIGDEADGLKDALKGAGDEALGLGDILKANLLSSAIIGGFQELTRSVGDFLSGTVSAAAELKAEASQFEQTFGNALTQEVATDAIGRVAEESGILATRLNTLGSKIYAFAKASGGTSAESMKLMETALQAAADSAAYYDVSVEQATETLQSFLKGNYENDAALGLSATETTRNAAAMEMFGQKFNNLTEIQKQQTLLKMVTDAQKLSGAMGQASRESDGLQNVMGNLSEVGRQIQGNIGAPILEAVVPAIQEITSALMEWSEGVDWDKFSENVSGFINGIIENGPTIVSLIASVGAGFAAWNVVSMIQGLISAITTFKTAVTGATTAFSALNTVMNGNVIGIVISAIAALVAILVTLWNTNEDFRNAVIEAWEGIKDFFAGIPEFITERVIDPIVASFKDFINWILFGVESFINFFINGINGIIESLNSISVDIPEWVPGIGGETFGFNIPTLTPAQLPRLAQGAVIPPNREFLAVLGDQSSGTNIEAPTSEIEAAVARAISSVGGLGGGDHTVILQVGEQELGRVIYRLSGEQTQRVGVRLGGQLSGGMA